MCSGRSLSFRFFLLIWLHDCPPCDLGHAVQPPRASVFPSVKQVCLLAWHIKLPSGRHGSLSASEFTNQTQVGKLKLAEHLCVFKVIGQWQ